MRLIRLFLKLIPTQILKDELRSREEIVFINVLTASDLERMANEAN